MHDLNKEIKKTDLIPGYEIIEKIHESNAHLIYRALKTEDNSEVIVKTFVDKYPKKEDLLKIQREFRITHQLEIDGVIKFFDIIPHSNGNLAIIMESFGISLNDYLSGFEKSILPINQFLPLAIKITKVCGLIHDKKLIHKKLEPSNILIDKTSKDIRIIDFSASSELSREHNESFMLSKWIEGSLAYVSPEQTGRINRDIDYRTDYYSLGITFYEMLTGQFPYNASDPMEWVHSIISRIPPSPDKINPKIPKILSEIVLKLISKNAEDRYQSSRGIIKDLEKCLELLSKGTINSKFKLGKSDISRKFQLPQKLYGREKEIEILHKHFENSTFGAVEFCLVSGYSGIGKTALVRELGSNIVDKKGYLIQGKFEQFKQIAPYATLGTAFSELIKQLLGESKQSLEFWKEKINQALGENAHLILDLIPDLEYIIGKQPTVIELPLEEAQNRFLKLLVNFITVFCNDEHPLVIFLDDLQWSDVPTLNLIKQLVTSDELSHLFIIGAYRDNEVDNTHPLNLTLREIQKKRVVENLSLQSLSLDATYEIINATLFCDPIITNALSTIIFEKTGGNPFFTIELLKNLKDKEVIQFNENKGYWDCNIESLEQENYTDNVLDILVKRQTELNTSTQQLLQLASCIGTTFDLRTLSIIKQSSIENIGTDLQDALISNMIIPLKDSYKYVSSNPSNKNEITFDFTDDLNPVYKFQHDRVQHAAYSQISFKRKEQMHLSIGQYILNHVKINEVEEKLIDIVGHLNKGRNLITDSKKRKELAQYNLAAGIKAKESSAYDSALEYLLIGHELLGNLSWQNDYEITWQLHNELQHCFYLTGDWKNADLWTETLLLNSKTSIEKGIVLSARTRQYATTERMKDSISAAYEGLSILGFDFILNPTSDDVSREVDLIEKNLQNRIISGLIDLPEISDQKAKIANQLLMEIFPAAFLSGSGDMFPYVVLKSVNIGLIYGNSPETAFAYAAYGMLLCGYFNDPAKGYEYGKLGVTLSDKINDISLKTRIIYVYTMFVHHWSNHWSSMTPWFRKGIDAGYQSGDLLYLAYSAQDCIIWDPTLDLESASEEHRKLLEIVEECEYQDSLDSGTLFLQMQLNFQGLTHSKFSLTDDNFDESKCFAGMQQRHFMTGICNYHIYKAEIHLLYNDPVGALKHVLEQEKRMASVMALPQAVRFEIIAFLVRSMLLTTLNPKNQELCLSKMRINMKQVSDWAKQCPENFDHLYFLMKAEMASFSGNMNDALVLYEKSISKARENGFRRDEAMANEFAAKTLLHAGFLKAAEGYLQESHYLYYRWGAYRKVKDIESTYQLNDILNVKSNSKGILYSKSASNNLDSLNTDLLDINSVLKASQTISGELILDKLLISTLKILTENSGAQKGFILVQNEGQLYISAKIENDKEQLNKSTSLKNADGQSILPITLINTALRTNEPIVIDNASKINPFTSDPYIKKNKPLSVICIPLPLHGKLPMAVYMENNLTSGAFTEDRIKVIKLLASQASISMENARIYERQEQLLKAQQRFVPIQFLKHLGHEDITKVELGESVSMDMTVLFTDIWDFTPLSENLSPQVIIHFLNRLFNEMGICINACDGFIDSYAGDQIMALFVLPSSNAIHAGIKMIKALEEFNASSNEYSLPQIKIGIGVNTGPLVLGTMGANERMQCSVLGDTVNLTSRIERLTRIYGAKFLIGEQTYNSLENPNQFSIRVVDYVAVKGKEIAVKLYEVLNAETKERRKTKEKTIPYLNKGMDAYYKRKFNDAYQIFKEANTIDPEDNVFSIFLSRSKKYIDNPPNENWKGFENLEVK